MTTHYQKIQALGNRMASNLETMGVSASFNDGGLTLADKILEINKFITGVLLSVDKPIEQSSNTINFTALVLKEGVAEAGKKVHFKGVYTNEITISSSSSNVDLGENGWIITLTGGTAKIGTLSKLLHITKTSSGYNVGVQSAGTTTNLQGSYVYYDGSSKILYSDVAYLDLSNASGIDQVDFTNLYSADSTFGTIGGVVRLPLYATTNSYGVATATYTCEGAGELTVQALCGSVVSQPYEVLDCLFMDYKADGTKNTDWYKNTNANVTYSDGETSVYATSNAWYISNQAVSGDFEATIECKNVNGNGVRIGFTDANTGSWNKSIRILFAYSDYYYLKFRRVNGAWTIQRSTDGETWTTYSSYDASSLTTEDCYFLIYVSIPSGSDERRLTYKNLKVYPI